MVYQPINLDQQFWKFEDHWSPKVIAEMNDYQIKLVKVQGEFVWHNHADTDEVFIVIEGTLDIEFRDGKVTLGAQPAVAAPVRNVCCVPKSRSS